MKTDIKFIDGGSKVALEMGTQDFLDFAKDLEVAHRATGEYKSDVKKFLTELKDGTYENLNDVAREQLIETKEHEVSTIQRALDGMEEIFILSNEL